MKKIFGLFINSILITILLFSATPAVQAEGEFSTEYSVNYNITANGETLVNYNVNIINKRADIVATKYSLSLKQMNIYEVAGADKKGKMNIRTDTKDDTTTVEADLNEQAVGLNKKNSFNISFKTKNIATKVGEIWNINIPPVQNLNTTDKYDVTINVPASFGPTIFVSPQNKEEVQNNVKIYKFSKDNILDKGITASFGQYQILNYNLKYQLKNDSIFPSLQEIALPPDIPNQQQVLYRNLSPAPVSVKQDGDGNILARYKVEPKKTLEISLTGSARIMGEQISPEFGGKMDSIPKDMIRRYTNDQKYWESSDPSIEKIAKELYKPENTVSQNAQIVYDFVTKNLSYDFEAAKGNFVERKGALAVLNAKDKAACMEFSDLFIAVSRAIGIPARELNGYAFSNTDSKTPLSVNLKGGDLLHAWPEYYDPNFGWVPVDPTWGNTSKTDYFTKLDTNHFVFVIQGLNSEYPLPAGAYRTSDNARLIDIDFANNANSADFTETTDIDQAKSFVKPEKFSVVLLGAISIGVVIIIFVLYYTSLKKNQFKP